MARNTWTLKLNQNKGSWTSLDYYEFSRTPSWAICVKETLRFFSKLRKVYKVHLKITKSRHTHSMKLQLNRDRDGDVVVSHGRKLKGALTCRPSAMLYKLFPSLHKQPKTVYVSITPVD